MKFGKSLNNQMVETLPEWRDKYLAYKDLKKRLNLLAGGGGDERRRPSKRQRGGDGSSPARAMTAAGFLALLEAELDKFNAFFLEKEEEYVIRQKELQDRVARAAARGSPEELMRVRKEVVDFHGEIVLLQNYSMLNYTGLGKILKKFDKRTGALIRLSFIQNVLQQPFYTTDLLYQLVKGCEAMLDQLGPRGQRAPVPNEDAGEDSDGDGDEPGSGAHRPSANGGGGGGAAAAAALELEEIDDAESAFVKSTVAALRALREIRSGSSTVSAFSLPPWDGDGGRQE
ncbi:hypothetical protein ACP4OV_009882 [Aristida adscensionis]